jgi:hypothetical protein
VEHVDLFASAKTGELLALWPALFAAHVADSAHHHCGSGIASCASDFCCWMLFWMLFSVLLWLLFWLLLLLNCCCMWVQVLRSDLFPELINHKVVKPIFAVVVALLFLAPQVTASSQHLLLASAGDAQQSRTLNPRSPEPSTLAVQNPQPCMLPCHVVVLLLSVIRLLACPSC